MNFVMEWHEIISQKTQLTSQKIESRSELGRKKKNWEELMEHLKKSTIVFYPISRWWTLWWNDTKSFLGKTQ